MNTASDVVKQLLAAAPHLAGQAHRLLSPVADARDDLRARLLDGGHILPLPDEGLVVDSIAAVDGGCVREHLYAADLMVAVATAAQGLVGGDHLLETREWAQVLAHESDNDRLLSAAMASLELRVIAAIGHDLRILDGSFGTPLIALMTALNSNSPSAAQHAVDLLDAEVLDAINTISTNPRVIALPKSDSAHAFTDTYRDLFDLEMPGGDKFMATQVLEHGEMLHPIVATKIGQLHVSQPHDATPTVEAAVTALDHAIRPLRTAAQQRRVLVTYLKPATADTVVKMEYQAPTALPTHPDGTHESVRYGLDLAAVLSAETPGPHLQEPYAQHAVDVAAKNVSIAASTIQQVMLGLLPDSADRYRHLLARGYRTS